MESEEGKFPGPRTIRTVRDKEIAKRNKLHDEHIALKNEETELNTILKKVQTLIETPAMDEFIVDRFRSDLHQQL